MKRIEIMKMRQKIHILQGMITLQLIKRWSNATHALGSVVSSIVVKLVRSVASIALIAMPILTSCEKGEKPTNGGEGNIITLTATSELPDTKTSLGNLNVVNWTADDKITTFWGNNATAAEFTLSTGDGTTSATFTGTRTETTDECYAIYPNTLGATIDAAKTISFTLPATQTYKAGGFANGANPMVAYKSATGALQFKNLCAVLKLQLKVASGTKTIKKITITSSTKKLSGAATVEMNYTGDNKPAISMATDASNIVTLDCTAEAGGGVTLSSTATPFYIVVPATASGETDNSFKITIESTTGGEIKSAQSSAGNRFNRAKIVVMPSFDYADAHYLDGGTSGTDRGAGIVIGATIWSPVNCGYDATNYKYGKLYQWGRKDGQGYYEKDTYEDATYPSDAQIAGPIPYNAVPDANYFYKGTGESAYQWMGVQTDGYFAFDGAIDWMALKEDASPHKDNAGIGNPCPTGWRVPTNTELTTLLGGNTSPSLVSYNGQNGAWFNGTSSPGASGVFLPAAGFRYENGNAINRGTNGIYWSGTHQNYSYVYALSLKTSVAKMSMSHYATGQSVRCVRDL